MDNFIVLKIDLSRIENILKNKLVFIKYVSIAGEKYLFLSNGKEKYIVYFDKEEGSEINLIDLQHLITKNSHIFLTWDLRIQYNELKNIIEKEKIIDLKWILLSNSEFCKDLDSLDLSSPSITFSSLSRLSKILLKKDLLERVFRNNKRFIFTSIMNRMKLIDMIDNSYVKINYICSEFFKKTDTNKIIPMYNPYNESGRLSNMHGSLNFLSMPKGIARKEVVSKFKGGRLLYYDYQNFEINIIRFLSNSKENYDIHTKISESLDEDRTIMKKAIFSLLFGAGDNLIEDLLKDKKELFLNLEDINKLIEQKEYILKEFVTNSHITLPFWKKIKIKNEDYEGKIFRLIVMITASEISAERFSLLGDILNNKQTAPIAVFHDAILVDYCPEEELSLLKTIKLIIERGSNSLEESLSHNHYFPSVVRSGKNFQEISN